MQKWEYLRLDVTSNDRTINPGIHSVVLNGKKRFNEEDSDSWELVSHTKSDYHEVHYFKRLIEK